MMQMMPLSPMMTIKMIPTLLTAFPEISLQHFDNVTVLFSDVVGFTTICAKISPMEVVGMLNSIYTAFDNLSEEKQVYKVRCNG